MSSLSSLSSSLSQFVAFHNGHPVPRSALYLLLGAACLGTISVASSLKNSIRADEPRTIPSPLKTILPDLSDEEIDALPYPPDALPGARDVDTPFGSIRVYEWGPQDGPRVLLIHGISTPSIALADLAKRLVSKGCRVMLFDLFGRGYSSGPSPKLHNYDAALYTTQILLCLASSPISWRPITLVGYSLGGALAADFTSQFPHLISNLFLIAPGGIIRSSHITWKSKLLYSTGGLLPEWMKEKLVASRLYTGPGSTRVPEPETELEAGSGVTRVRGSEDDVYNSSHHRLLSSNPHSTVGNVVDWQLKYHVGFVPAFISSIRYAPIHEQQHRWQRIGEYMNGGPLTPPPPPPEEEAVAPPPSEAGSTSGRRRRRRSDASAVSTSTTSSRRKRSHKNSSSDGFGWFMKSSSSKSKSSKSSSSKESTKSTSTKETHKKSESRDKTSEPRLLKKVYLILGETDPIIIAEEVAQDAREVLGEEHVRVKIMEGVGHEVAIERAEEISELIGRALKL